MKDLNHAFASFQADRAVSLFNLFLDSRGSFGFYNICFLALAVFTINETMLFVENS